jgi:hypothetical protein
MSAVIVIQNLLTLGVQIKDAATKSGQTLASFLESPAFTTIEASADNLLASLQPQDLRDAINAIQKKEADLQAGRPMTSLSADELTQFHALLDLEDKLVNKLVAEPNKKDFITILVNDVLPTLVQVVKIVVPLLT